MKLCRVQLVALNFLCRFLITLSLLFLFFTTYLEENVVPPSHSLKHHKVTLRRQAKSKLSEMEEPWMEIEPSSCVTRRQSQHFTRHFRFSVIGMHRDEWRWGAATFVNGWAVTSWFHRSWMSRSWLLHVSHIFTMVPLPATHFLLTQTPLFLWDFYQCI